MITVELRDRFARAHEKKITEWVKHIGAMGPFFYIDLRPPLQTPTNDNKVTLGDIITMVTLHAERYRNGDLVIYPASRADAALIDQWCREQEALVE